MIKTTHEVKDVFIYYITRTKKALFTKIYMEDKNIYFSSVKYKLKGN